MNGCVRHCLVFESLGGVDEMSPCVALTREGDRLLKSKLSNV